MELNINTTQVSDSQVIVDWRSSNSEGNPWRGRLALDVPPEMKKMPSKELAVMAELFSIQHLLTQRRVFGHCPESAIRAQITVSRGAIRKMHQGKEVNNHAKRWSRYLRTRCNDATLKVEKNPAWLNIPPRPNLDTRERLSLLDDGLYLGQFGKIVITRHALDRFADRFETASGLKCPWSTLVKQLRKSECNQVALPGKMKAFKSLLHRGDEEIWINPKNGMHYVMVPEGDTRVLVTVFHRHENKYEVQQQPCTAIPKPV